MIQIQQKHQQLNKLASIWIVGLLLSSTLISQTNLAPLSAATAQTFGTFSRGLDAINWNPASLALHSRDTVFHIYTATLSTKSAADSMEFWLKDLLHMDSLYIKIIDRDNISEILNEGLKTSVINNDTLNNRTPEFNYKIYIITTPDKEESQKLSEWIKEDLHQDSLFAEVKITEEDSSYIVHVEHLRQKDDAIYYLAKLKEAGYESVKIDSLPKIINEKNEPARSYFQNMMAIFSLSDTSKQDTSFSVFISKIPNRDAGTQFFININD